MKLRHTIAIGMAAGALALGSVVGHSTTPQCHIRGTTVNTVLPDPICTPGVTDPLMTAQKLCDPSFRTGTIRNVPQAEKDQVAKEYGISSLKGYEVDHLISLELGGSNDIKNLWSELGFPNPKDKIENKLHKEVCNRQMTLQEAQTEIRTDWTKIP